MWEDARAFLSREAGFMADIIKDGEEIRRQEQAGQRDERLRLEGESEAPGKSIGGVSGRPMNRRNHPAEADDSEAAEHANDGGMQGSNRSPKVLEKQRKNRVA
jgi:hypothetical protein